MSQFLCIKTIIAAEINTEYCTIIISFTYTGLIQPPPPFSFSPAELLFILCKFLVKCWYIDIHHQSQSQVSVSVGEKRAHYTSREFQSWCHCQQLNKSKSRIFPTLSSCILFTLFRASGSQCLIRSEMKKIGVLRAEFQIPNTWVWKLDNNPVI